MEKFFDVLTFGDLCVDMIISGKDVTPEFGQSEKLLEDYSIEMGGSCSIFACQTAKLNLRTAIVGKIGDDEFGRKIQESLEEAGVCTDYVKVDSKLKTGVSLALNNGNDRAILTYVGTIDAMNTEDITDDMLKGIRHLHIGSYFLMKNIQKYYPKIIKTLKEYDATISLDTNWDPNESWDSGIWDILPYIDIFFPNLKEAMAITKRNSAEEAINDLKKFIPIVAVKQGEHGAVVYSQGKTYYANSLESSVVDAIGAGDTFDAGFIYGFLTGKTIEQCANIGCICGSLNVRQAGGIKGQPKTEELNRFLES
jgi:sugar/nucleoside kinase (ribokinase family)